MKQFRIPDWVLLYFKLEAKIPDNAWQTMINLTKLGRTWVGVFLFMLARVIPRVIFLIFFWGGGGGGLLRLCRSAVGGSYDCIHAFPSV